MRSEKKGCLRSLSLLLGLPVPLKCPLSFAAMSLCAVLDVLLVEVHGFLQEPPLLAVCRLAHRKAAFEAHLRWLVGYWRLTTERVRAQHDFLVREVRTSRRVLHDMLFRVQDHPHAEGRLSEYAITVDKVYDRLSDALRARVRLSSDA